MAGPQNMSQVEQALAQASRLAKQGKTADAERICRQVLVAMPRFAPAYFVAGEIAEARKSLDAAIDNYRKATALQPDYFPAWLNLGACLRDQGDHEAAIAAYEQAIRIDRRSAQAYNNLASAYVTIEQFDNAIANFERALKLRPNSVDIRRNLASLYMRTARNQKAIELARSSLALDENDARSWAILGRCLQIEGKFEEAEATLLRALDIDPVNSAALYDLTTMKRDPTEELAALEAIEATLADVNRRPEAPAGLHFAVARLHERHKNYDAAFSHYVQGNAIRSDHVQFTEAGAAKLFDATIATFTPDFFESVRIAGNPTTQPIFIVGMPRSGTTLTEQIIARHPDAAAAGELMTLRELLQPPRRVDVDRNRYLFPDEAETASISEIYLEALREGRASALRITDKLPFNFLNLGFIKVAFPQAKVIHCRRDPMDTCLSCFCQSFHDDLAFSFNLENLGAYYRLYSRLMRHWKAVLPNPILEVDYERVIENPETAIRAIIEYCELPWNDACLAPHEGERDVRTASVWQVRQPIYRSSVAKWKRYEKHLQPLKDALGDLYSESDPGGIAE